MMPEAEQQSVGEDFLRSIVETFGYEAAVSSEYTDDGLLSFDVEGSGLGLLIGPGLGTLDALQEITRNVIQRAAAGREYGKVTLDVCGAREARRTALEAFTREQATKVLDDGEDVIFDPMSRSDRKIVHDVIAEFDGLATESVGEDPRRRVILRRA
jgi:spoIIIJ-associated protein